MPQCCFAWEYYYLLSGSPDPNDDDEQVDVNNNSGEIEVDEWPRKKAQGNGKLKKGDCFWSTVDKFFLDMATTNGKDVRDEKWKQCVHLDFIHGAIDQQLGF